MSWAVRCDLAPEGWFCSRDGGHEGPCAAWPKVTMVVMEVLEEVNRAIAKFPTWPTDPLHAVGVVGEESGELYKAVLQQMYEPHKNKPGDVRAEAIQTAAMALRFIAGLDHYKWTPGEQYEQHGI